MQKICRVFVSLAAILVSGILPAAPPPAPAAGDRSVTFLSTSDSHYAAFINEDRNDRNRATLMKINAVAELKWPESLGGGGIDKPRGVVWLGDCIDDGDRLFEGKNQTAPQFAAFARDVGLDGTDGFLKFPVFESWGNHDGPPVGKEKNGFSFQAQLKKRNALRKEKGLVKNLSENGLHYSWDWDDVHFVQLGLYPADKQREGVKYSPIWHNPQDALAFLKQDLAKNVGDSRRPVVLMSHCGFDTNWWSPDDWKETYDAAKSYNIVLYLYGHTGTGIKPWAPEGESKKWLCINDGQTENGFFVISIGKDQLRYGYHCKVFKSEPGPNGKPKKVDTGQWEWRYTGSARLGQ